VSSPPPVLSIVITTRDRYSELEECVRSIARSTIDLLYELIVVDDCSSDKTRDLTGEEIREWCHAGEVTVIHSAEHLKMVRARNKGAVTARGRFVLFVDDDNVVDESMVMELIHCVKSSENIGIVGPSMYSSMSRVKYFDTQAISLFTAHTKCRTRSESLPPEIIESDGIPNVFLVKREVFEKAGYFDNNLIQSFTEPDFSLNARRFGFRTVVCNAAKTYHNIDPGERSREMGSTPAKAYCLIRNRFVIVRRYGGLQHLLVFLIFFSWVWPLIYSFVALRSGDYGRIKYYLAGFIDGFYFAITGKFRSNKEITG